MIDRDDHDGHAVFHRIRPAKDGRGEHLSCVPCAAWTFRGTLPIEDWREVMTSFRALHSTEGEKRAQDRAALIMQRAKKRLVMCCDALMESLEAEEEAGGIVPTDDGWSVSGCCHGGCYVLTDLRFCPFCGTHLPT